MDNILIGLLALNIGALIANCFVIFLMKKEKEKLEYIFNEQVKVIKAFIISRKRF